MDIASEGDRAAARGRRYGHRNGHRHRPDHRHSHHHAITTATATAIATAMATATATVTATVPVTATATVTTARTTTAATVTTNTRHQHYHDRRFSGGWVQQATEQGSTTGLPGFTAGRRTRSRPQWTDTTDDHQSAAKTDDGRQRRMPHPSVPDAHPLGHRVSLMSSTGTTSGAAEDRRRWAEARVAAGGKARRRARSVIVMAIADLCFDFGGMKRVHE